MENTFLSLIKAGLEGDREGTREIAGKFADQCESGGMYLSLSKKIKRILKDAEKNETVKEDKQPYHELKIGAVCPKDPFIRVGDHFCRTVCRHRTELKPCPDEISDSAMRCACTFQLPTNEFVGLR